MLEMGWEHRAEGDRVAKGSEVVGLRRASSSVPPPMQAGSSPVSRWCRCCSQQCFWGCGAPSPPSTGKGLRWGQAGGSSTKPGHLDGASRHPRTEGTFDAPSPVLSNVKQKLWPPVPDLHRALGSFIQESGKHGQVRGWGRAAQLLPGAARRAAPTESTPCPSRPAPWTSSRWRKPSCPACWRCCPARGARRARRRSTLGAACPAPTSPTNRTCS